jgi:predicted enzyme related to lactoylglutathione lyase
MTQHLSNIGLWVRDQDEAAAFYTEKLGFEIRDDVTLPEFNNYRWLTVASPGQDVALALNVPGPPFDADKVEAIRRLMADGMLGGLFIATDDCQASYEEVRSRGVQFDAPPTQQPYGLEAILHDPSGNSIRLVQAP